MVNGERTKAASIVKTGRDGQDALDLARTLLATSPAAKREYWRRVASWVESFVADPEVTAQEQAIELAIDRMRDEEFGI